MTQHHSLGFFELPYRPDSSHWFHFLRSAGHAVWLDSNNDYHADANHTTDIMSAAPIDWVIGTETNCLIDKQGKRITGSSLIDALHTFIKPYQGGFQQKNTSHYPVPGFMGYLSYDAGHSLQYLPTPTLTEPTLPLLYFGFYPWLLVNDHKHQHCMVVYLTQWVSESTIRHYLDQESSPEIPFQLQTTWQHHTSKRQYQHAIERIHQYLEDGDCYQVNFAQSFSARYQGDPLEAYRRLRKAYPAPYSAFIEIPEGTILSVSPELFLNVREQEVTTKPIKGTRPRSTCPTQDATAVKNLSTSAKDQAENVMIVDLMRNDLARCCEPGSIKVPKLFDIEHYQSVHHLVSTVTGQLRPECTIFDLLSSTFPGGSITGAPKRRAMEIIQALEAKPRQVYCGSIGRIGLDHSADFNIAIRTAICHQSTIHMWGGGGIVIESESNAEYQESWDKIRAILACLSPKVEECDHDER